MMTFHSSLVMRIVLWFWRVEVAKKDEKFCIKNLGSAILTVFLSTVTTKYLQPFNDYLFQDIQYFVKEVSEYSKNPQSINCLLLCQFSYCRKHTKNIICSSTSSLHPFLMKGVNILSRWLYFEMHVLSSDP